MNNLNKYLPNEIIDIIAKKLHESIMLDLNEEFEEAVEMNKNRHMCFTCEMTDGYCRTCWNDFEPEEEFDSWRHFYNLRRSPDQFYTSEMTMHLWMNNTESGGRPPWRRL